MRRGWFVDYDPKLDRRDTGKSVDESLELRKEWLRRYPMAKRYGHKTEAEASAWGMTVDKKFWPGLHSGQWTDL